MVFGSMEIKPTKGFPHGKVRFKFRTGEFAVAYVKTKDGIRMFYVKDEGDSWTAGPEIARNLDINKSAATGSERNDHE